MTTATATRRTLNFASIDDAAADARALLAGGYTKGGNWSLGQVCGHLARWIVYPLDGYPPIPVPVRVGMWVIRNTVGPAQKRKFLAGGGMSPGLPTLTQSVVPADAADAAGVEEYARQVERLKAFTGTPKPSPLLGPLTRDELARVSYLHAAHHLSFLTPAK